MATRKKTARKTARKKTVRKKKTASATGDKIDAAKTASSSKRASRKKKSNASEKSKSPRPAGASQLTGALNKMRVVHNDVVEYFLPVGESDELEMNALVGRTLTIRYENRIECVHCGRKTSKSFSQGYCFPCMRKLAQCDSCIVKPELCHYHEGTCREPEWGERNCLQPHVVYIANTSGLKVGITRATQIPTRWIDQGAHRAIPLLEARDRRMSGLAEVAIKQAVADRTDFRRMLKGPPEERDMDEAARELKATAEQALDAVRAEHGEDAIKDASDTTTRAFDYPVDAWPEKVTSVTLDKVPEISETLTGIKGQYLMFGNRVFNVRRHGGYIVTVQAT